MTLDGDSRQGPGKPAHRLPFNKEDCVQKIPARFFVMTNFFHLATLNTMNSSRFSWTGIVGITLLMVLGLQLPDAEAKRRKSHRQPPLKILDISMDPVPFTPGTHSLEITVTVGIPRSIKGDHLLEVSSLISLPSRRSIRFLAHRQPVTIATSGKKTQTIQSVLKWDGKNQQNTFMEPGTYTYEIRAKLLANGENGPRTAMVSRRARGELKIHEAIQTPTEEAPAPHHPEHVPFVSDDTPSEELELEGAEEGKDMAPEDSPDTRQDNSATPPEEEETPETEDLTPALPTH